MTCVKSLYTGGSAIQNQDWATLGASAATIVGKGLIYAGKQSTVLANALKTSGTKILPTPTAIVDAAAIAVLLVDFLNGFGTPNSGAAVTTAAKDLDLYMQQLDPSCIPDSRDWSGDAATAYTNQVKALKGYAQTYKGYDATLKGYVANQGAKVKEAHMCVTVNVAVLTAAAGVALLLYLIPITGPAWSCAWQIVAAFACCMAVLALELMTMSNGFTVSHQVSALGEKYVQLGKDVEKALAGTYGKIEGKVATESSSQLSNFRGISDGLTSFSFAPSVSSLASQAGDNSSSQRAFADASSGTEGAAAKGSDSTQPHTPAAPAAAAPAASFSPPSLAQVSAMSAQAQAISQPFNSMSQTVSQGVSQIQQAAQSSKGQDPAPPPADDAKDKDAEAAAAGAAAGGDGSERAPVDAGTSGAAPAAAGRERPL